MRAFARVAIFKTGRGKAQNLTKKRGRPTAKLKMSRDFAALLWVACYHLKMCACATSTIWYQSLSPSGEVKPFSTHTSLQETRATIGHGSWLWSPFNITTIHSWCDVFSNSRSITAARHRFKMFSFSVMQSTSFCFSNYRNPSSRNN